MISQGGFEGISWTVLSTDVPSKSAKLSGLPSAPAKICINKPHITVEKSCEGRDNFSSICRKCLSQPNQFVRKAKIRTDPNNVVI